MPRYPIGAMLLLLSMIAFGFGMGGGIARSLRLTSKTIFLALLLWWLALFIDLPLGGDLPWVGVNAGGALLPLVYGFALSGKTTLEPRRFWLALATVALSGLIGMQVLGMEADHFLWDGHWLFTLLGAVGAAAVAAESRGALAAILLGSVLVETIAPFVNAYGSLTSLEKGGLLGSGIVFDRIVLSAFFVLVLTTLSERVGEWKPEKLRETGMEPVRWLSRAIPLLRRVDQREDELTQVKQDDGPPK
ncbi:hypothetical protein GTO89_01820 [Heliobacterium gestii]|uniref:DUF1614 domain-containing protein n=1 Tax=Heliomicrobium gestii TaxID=2699 RepID=A0A845L6D4_HELGE|nr:hypothetical protein [Heliomicrobium gestii]MBM7865516.1 hypothetical protein [Heliomicrobium gestii]MZP41768.1 hypothetical protein [Heliomicrobium gestii]